MTAPGNLFIISAPSGCGKTSLVRRLIERLDDLEVSVSHTTRARREGEVDGRHYHFVDETTFERMANEGAFLEHAVVFDRRYGTSRRVLEERLAAGIDVLLEIDWQGARAVRAARPQAITVFVLPPSLQALEQRLHGRGDEAGAIARRMRDAVSEMSHYDEYDYLIFNEQFEQAAQELLGIVIGARLRLPLQRERHRERLAALLAG